MSQQLVPISGGVQQVQTSTSRNSFKVLSVQSIETRKLENRPTEWEISGRPIYRRLPAVSETYQTNFFNILPASNTAVALYDTQDTGYVYIPWGQGIFGPLSMEAVSSDSRENLLVKAGQVVWKYGTTVVPPVILNLKEINYGSGRYLLAYRLVYDDAPTDNYYRVTDYSLAGTELVLTSSSDNVVGWRYPSLNAFLGSTAYWSNNDTYFPSYAQPTECFMQWESNEFFQSSPLVTPSALPSAYSNVTLRCPSGTNYSGNATLSYVNSASLIQVSQVEVSSDTEGQFFQFEIDQPSLQTGWRIDFSDLNVKIQSITVSGVITKVTKPASPSTKCVLTMYPADSVPSFIINTEGEEIPATYCNIAYVDIDSDFKLRDIQDIRPIIHREYKPIADWLTAPFDEDLINLYQQVKGYSVVWMSPVVSMKQEYQALRVYGVELT